mgnify:FL=1
MAYKGTARFIGQDFSMECSVGKAPSSRHHTISELAKFASQGATFGAVYIFTTVSFYLFLNPDAYLYNFLAIGLPRFLLGALLAGLISGILMWVSWRLSKRPLGKFSRAIIGILLLIACCPRTVHDFFSKKVSTA